MKKLETFVENVFIKVLLPLYYYYLSSFTHLHTFVTDKNWNWTLSRSAAITCKCDVQHCLVCLIFCRLSVCQVSIKCIYIKMYLSLWLYAPPTLFLRKKCFTFFTDIETSGHYCVLRIGTLSSDIFTLQVSSIQDIKPCVCKPCVHRYTFPSSSLSNH